MAERRPASLQWRITLGAIAYMLLLSLAVVYHGNAVNERAEEQMWRSLLDAGLRQYLARSADDPAYRWHDSDGSVLYGESAAVPIPPALARVGIAIAKAAVNVVFFMGVPLAWWRLDRRRTRRRRGPVRCRRTPPRRGPAACRAT